MRAYLGTSGYAYKEWIGSFYPPKTSTKKMLAYYAERFTTVEANNTFYRMPTKEAVAAWLTEVPPGFVFACKAPQQITHFKRLKEDSYQPLAHFVDVVSVLGEALGPLLFQLPPNMKKDAPRLAAFLAEIPRERRAAFEFRHESWFDDETFTLLAKHNASLVVSESEKLEAPLQKTADWIYLRLRREDYTTQDLVRWSSDLTKLGVATAYIYFKHEDAGTGPKLAAEMRALLDAKR